MRKIGAKFIIFFGLTLVILAAFLVVMRPVPTTPTVYATTATSIDDFSQALNQMIAEYDATENSLFFLDKETDLTSDGDGNYLISDDTYQKLGGKTESNSRLMPQSVFFTDDSHQLNDLATEVGYEVTDNGQDVVLTRRFGLKRLILYSDNPQLDTHGAVAAIQYRDMHIYQYATETATIAAYEYFQTRDDVEDLHPDSYCWAESTSVTIDTEQTKTYSSWGAKKMGAPEYNQYLQDVAKANGSELPEVVVAVLDTGIDSDHPWFTDRILTDSNGNLVGSNRSAKPGTFEDDEGHGTHCAGIICDMTLPNVKILPVKFMYKDPTKPLAESVIGNTSQAELGIQDVIEKKLNNHYNIVAINMSFGNPGSSNVGFSRKIHNAKVNGILSVVAAGNDHTNLDTTTYTPADIDEAIVVSALEYLKHYDKIIFNHAESQAGNLFYSNYGHVIDVSAPGTFIESANAKTDGPSDMSDTIEMSGTSMAAPHVVGYIASLMSDVYQNYSINTVYNILNNGGNPDYLEYLGDTPEEEIYYGYGMPVLKNAIPDYVTIEVNSNNLGQVTIEPAGIAMYAKGTNVTLTFTPDEGAYVAEVCIDGVKQTNSNGMPNYTFTNLTQSHTVNVVFESNSYVVNYYLEALNPTTQHPYDIQSERFTGNIGEQTNVTAKDFVGFTPVGTIEQQTILANGKTTVAVYYTRNRYQVAVTIPANDNGVERVIGAGEYAYGATVTLTPEFYIGYCLSGWECNNNSLNLKLYATKQKFIMPDGNLDFTVHSKESRCQVSLKINGTGTVTPSAASELNVRYNQGLVLQITAGDGQELSSISCDGTELQATKISDSVYSLNLSHITSDLNLTVNFVPKKNAVSGFQTWIMNGGGAVLSVVTFGGLYVLLVVLFRLKRSRQ